MDDFHGKDDDAVSVNKYGLFLKSSILDYHGISFFILVISTYVFNLQNFKIVNHE